MTTRAPVSLQRSDARQPAVVATIAMAALAAPLLLAAVLASWKWAGEPALGREHSPMVFQEKLLERLAVMDRKVPELISLPPLSPGKPHCVRSRLPGRGARRIHDRDLS